VEEQLKKMIAALRAKPRRAVLALVALVVVFGLVRLAWRYRSPETWIAVSPQVQLVAGTPQKVSVALMYRPRFRARGQARPIAGKIQLLSFNERVTVAPTTVETTPDAPEAVFTVKGLRAGEEELAFAASQTPDEASSWRTASMKALIAPAPQVKAPATSPKGRR
jgi:hypothetical protein